MAINAGEILVRFRADSRQAVREFSQFRRTMNNTIVTTRAQVRDLNRSINGFSLAAGIGLGAAILKIGSSYDKAITNVRAITKETEEQFESTRQSAILLASDYGKAADEVGGALFQIVSAGKRGEEAMQTLTAATKLSKAGLVDVAVATDVLIGSLNAFDIEGTKAEDIAGKLIGTVDRGILTFEQLAGKLGQVSPIANTAGLELEDLLGIIALLTREGVPFNQAITNARGAIIKLVAPGKEARKEIEKILGATIENTLAAKGYVGTLEQLVSVTGNSLATFKRLFEDTEAIAGVATIASAGFDTLRGDIEALEKAGAGNLNRTLEIQAASFSQLSTELTNLIKNRVVAFFEDNADAILGTTQAIIDFLRENEAFVDAIIAGSAAIAALTVAGLGLKAFLIAADAILGTVAFTMNLFTGSTNVNTQATVANTVVRTASKTAVNAQTTAMVVQTTALRANTIGYVASAVAQRRYVANTAASAVATNGFTASMRKLFPTFLRIPALIGASIGILKGFAIAASIVAAKILALIAVFAIFFKLGEKIGRMISGNTKEYADQAERLKELDKVQAGIAQRTQKRLLQERSGLDAARASAAEYRDTIRALAVAQTEAAKGSASAARDVLTLTDRLRELKPASVDALGTASDQLKRYENVIINALRETEQFSDTYKGAFTDGGRLLQGFGESLTEISALELTLGQDNAEGLIQNIRDLKDEISGVAAAERELAESSERAKTASGLLGSAIAQSIIVSDEYAQSLDELLNRSRQLTQGEFTQSFNVIRDDLVASNDAVSELITQIERLQSTAQQMNIEGADPAVLEQSVEQISNLEAQLEKAAEAATRFNQALFALVDEQQAEITESRLEAIDKIKQAEIKALRDVGSEREADLLAAELRREQSIQRVQVSLDEEIERRKEINELISAGDITQGERDALQLTIERSEALTRLYEDQKDGIDEAYDRELVAIERNDKERTKRLLEQEKRRTILALNEEKSAQARIALQAIISGEIDKELAARERIAELELEIIAAKGIQAGQELELIDSIKERIELLKQELESIRNAGGTIDDAIRAARDAQRDTGGTSDVEGGREQIQNTLDDAQTKEGVESTAEAFRTALDVEFQKLQEKRKEAVKRGDKEEVEAIDARVKEITEIWRIFTDEIKNRLQEITLEEDARKNATPSTIPGTTPATAPTTNTPANTTTPTAPGTQGTQPPSQTKGTNPQENQDIDAVTDTLREEVNRTREQVATATDALIESAEIVGKAINDLGETVVFGFNTVTKKLEEVANQVNENTASIRASTTDVERLRIEGR